MNKEIPVKPIVPLFLTSQTSKGILIAKELIHFSVDNYHKALGQFENFKA
jgi:hypothetical protein